MDDSQSIERAKSFFINGLERLNNNNFVGAEIAFQASLNLDPNSLTTILNLSVVLIKLNKLQDAEKLIDKGLLLYPKNAQLLLKLLDVYDALLIYKPEYAEVYSNRGVIYEELHLYEKALIEYETAIKIKNDYAVAYLNLGNVLNKLKRYEDAIHNYNKAIELDFFLIEVYSYRGVAFKNLKSYDKSMADYDKAIIMNPNNFDAYSKRGSLLNDLGRCEEALVSFNTAIKINSNFEEAFLNRGNLFNDLKKYGEAIEDYDRAIFINPEYAEAHSNRGNTLNEIAKYDDALISLNKSIDLKSDNEMAYYNRGVVLRNLNLYNAALVDYSKAIDIKYDYPEAHWNKSLILLLTQKLKEGWSLYKEWRWKIKIEFSKKLDTKIPYWNRQNTNNQSKILLWAEQGIGDEIFYFGMLKNFSDTDARVTVSADTRLHALFKRSMPELEFVDRKEIDNICDENAFDFQAPIGDIGQLFSVDRSLEHKTPKPFFQINQSRCSEIKNKNHFLSDKFVCGISWKSTNKDIGITKSLNLIDLSPLLSIENVVFVSLQYGSTADEIEFFEKNIGIKIHTIDGLDIFNDIDGLVSLISLCDLVVTTSNITAHLTGAIGKKGMVLMPFSKGKIWYWHSGVGPSLWYPSLELVSQSQMNDWTDPINKCKEWVLGQL